ncbi:MAG: DNA-directed DNA polymerase I [Candidatus Hodarchaeales archaeon]
MTTLKPERDYFLLSTVYDPDTNGAGIKLFDVKGQKLVYTTDTYGHEPYCLTRTTLDELEGIRKELPLNIVKRIESVVKNDLLNDTKVTLSRIVTQTPNEVPRVREILAKHDFETLESRIKYHRNWLYDTQLIPGRKYWWDPQTKKFIPPKSESTGLEIPQNIVNSLSQYKDLLEVFSDDFIQEIPEIPIVAFDIETEYEEGQIPQANDPKFPVICVCFVDSKKREIALVLERENVEKGHRPSDLSPNLEIIYFKEESELIKKTFEILQEYSIICTFNGDSFDLPYLHSRANHLNIKKFSPIKWNRRNKECNFKTAIHIDLYRFYHNVAIKTYAFGNKYQEGSLDAIASALLGVGKISLEKEISMLTEWELLEYCSRDAKITLDLLLFDERTPLNLIFILSRISRIPIDDLVRTSVSNWVRSLFYFEHRRRGDLIPNKEDIQIVKGLYVSSEAIIKGKKYKGATVIKPVPGIHFNVAVLDFASLYPSIISTRNLSYETMLCGHDECKTNIVPQTNYWVCTKRRGIMADIIGFIKDMRVQWLKPASKKPSENRAFYHILERSLKVLINASYGVLGSDRFPLYCLPVADSTTAYGRDAISKTIEKAESLNVTVLYGDTDSVFLLSPTNEQVEEIIKWSKSELGVGLEMEKVYRYVVLSNRKKNYFGVYPDSSVDVKGLMGKKRNTPPFLQKVFSEVLTILSQVNSLEEFTSAKEHVKKLIRTVYLNLEKNKYSPEDLVITMQLTQPLQSYKVNSQHVKAARQLENYYRKKYGSASQKRSLHGEFVKAGQLIRFVKTKDGDRVTPIELMDKRSKVDVKSYKSMVDSTFSQLLGALDINMEELSSGQINLMEFFS